VPHTRRAASDTATIRADLPVTRRPLAQQHIKMACGTAWGSESTRVQRPLRESNRGQESVARPARRMSGSSDSGAGGGPKQNCRGARSCPGTVEQTPVADRDYREGDGESSRTSAE